MGLITLFLNFPKANPDFIPRRPDVIVLSDEFDGAPAERISLRNKVMRGDVSYQIRTAALPDASIARAVHA